jgi:hypothetical protein
LSGENERKLREELRAAVNEKDYTNAVAKAEEMASYFEEIGDNTKAQEAWENAANLFLEWSQVQRQGRTHKNSAKSLVHAADIFGKLGVDSKAAQAIDLAAQDLVQAGDEYLVWKQPLGAGVCYTTAAIMFILVSQEGKAQEVLNQVKTRLDALRQDSTATALLDLPAQLLQAKHQLDIRLLNNVKTIIYSSLLPALTNSGLSEFNAYVERTVLGIETYINSTQQYPVLDYELKMDGEVIIDSPFDIEVLITNNGQDTAYNVTLEMVPKEEVTIVREFSKLKANEIPPGSAAALTWRCIVKSENVIEETQQLNLSGRLSFTDSRNLQQTLSISPIAFRTVSPKQTDQIKMEIKVVKEQADKVKEKMIGLSAEKSKAALPKIMDILAQLVEQAEGFIEAGAIQNAKSWSSLLQLQLELIKDVPNQLKDSKEE